MRRFFLRPLLLALIAANAACAAEPAPPERPCGLAPGDWCEAPAGDPCGAHRDEAACRADARCIGMRYRGESVVACQPDGKGFWSNCPAVGCVSQRPAESAQPRR